jgi:hypothetical protein
MYYRSDFQNFNLAPQGDFGSCLEHTVLSTVKTGLQTEMESVHFLSAVLSGWRNSRIHQAIVFVTLNITVIKLYLSLLHGFRNKYCNTGVDHHNQHSQISSEDNNPYITNLNQKISRIEHTYHTRSNQIHWWPAICRLC